MAASTVRWGSGIGPSMRHSECSSDCRPPGPPVDRPTTEKSVRTLTAGSEKKTCLRRIDSPKLEILHVEHGLVFFKSWRAHPEIPDNIDRAELGRSRRGK